MQNSKVLIRSISYGIDVSKEALNRLKTAPLFLSEIPKAFQQMDLPVQTQRLILPPIELNNQVDLYSTKSLLNTSLEILNDFSLQWVCLPIQKTNLDTKEAAFFLKKLIYEYPALFLHFMISHNGKTEDKLLQTAAKTVLHTSTLSSNGYDNFRVGLGANIRANTPFFPFSYHSGDTGFSIALDVLVLLLDEIEEYHLMPHPELKNRLIHLIVPILKKINEIGEDLEKQYNIHYKGLDLSLAPYPDNQRSVAKIIQKLGPQNCGQVGTLTITAFLTSVIKTAVNLAEVRATGFNGVMFSLLEDGGLAFANNTGHLNIEKLMLYSTVCGCGLDMIPIPGNTFEEDIIHMGYDLSALSTRLKKPLGLRMLPIPTKSVNEMTDFNHTFLTNTRVLPVGNSSQDFSFATLNQFTNLS